MVVVVVVVVANYVSCSSSLAVDVVEENDFSSVRMSATFGFITPFWVVFVYSKSPS